MLRKIVIVLLPTILLVAASCKQSKTDGASNGATSGLQGDWKVDIEALKNNEFIKQQGKQAEQAIKIFQDAKFTFTEDTMSMQMELFGETKKQQTKYEMLSQDGEIIKIKILDGKEQGTERKIKQLSKDRIELISENDKPSLVLTRI